MATEFDPDALIDFPSAQKSGTFNPDALIPGASQVLTESFQANFDPDNFASSKLRLSLSRGDNLQEKRLRVKKVFPEGDVRVIDVALAFGKRSGIPTDKEALVFRESAQSQWKRVDPPGVDVTDIGELLAPSAESIALETGAALFTSGGSIPATVGRQVIGAFAGESIEQGIQSVRGVQAQTPGEILMEPTIEGGFSALGGFAMSPFVAAGNIASGRGALQIGEEGLETIKAAKRIDPELANKLTPGLVTDNPALQLSERQSAALLPGFQRRYRELVKTLDKAVRGNINQTAFKNITKRVSESFKNLSDTFLRRIGRSPPQASKGGKAVQQGIEEYDLVGRKLIDGLYDVARKIEEPQFDFQLLANVAQDLRAGAKGAIDPQTESLLKQIEAIEGPIPLSNGGSVSITDQLRNVRTGAYAAKNIPTGDVASQATGQANDIFKAINQTIDNPINPNKAFKEAWRWANDAARIRFDTLEKAVIIKAAKSQNPAELVARYAKPGEVGNLQTIRNSIDSRRWKEFTDEFVASVFDNPAGAKATLDGFDQETIDVLLSRSEQGFLNKIGTEFARITDVGVEETIEKQIRNKNFIGSIIEQANPQRTRTIMRAANETNNKAMRESIRAGVFDWAWDGIVKQGKRLEINQPLLKARIEALKKSGVWGFLPALDRQLLGDVEVVSRAFRRVIDAGTAIQAAEAVKGVARLQAGAIRSFLQAGFISHFYLSPAGRRILIGSGLPNSRGASLRLIGGALAQISRTEDVSDLQEQ